MYKSWYVPAQKEKNWKGRVSKTSIAKNLKKVIVISEETPVRYEDDWKAREYSGWVIFYVDNLEIHIPDKVLEKVLNEMP